MNIQKFLDSQDYIAIVFDNNWNVEYVSKPFFDFFTKERLEEIVSRIRNYPIGERFIFSIENHQYMIFTFLAKLVKVDENIVLILYDFNLLQIYCQLLEEPKDLLSQYQKAVDSFAIVSKTDPSGRITYVNDNFVKVSGYTKEELLGHKFDLIRHPEMPAYVFKKMWRTLKQKKIWKGILRNRAKDGKDFYVQLVIVPILENERIKEYIGIGVDITKLIRAKERAQKAKRSKSIFLANMSHEIRTPLTAILGFIEVLRHQNLPPQTKEIVEILAQSSQTLLEIVNDILEISKIQKEGVTLHPEPCDTSTSCKSVAELFRTRAEQKGIHYNYSINLPECIVVDEHRLKQVISNLIGNAIKFTPAGGKIFVKMEEIEQKSGTSKILFSVEDSGIGIPKERQQKIFKPFVQADEEVYEKFGGTGLGLTISDMIVKKMGSHIQLWSEEGVGSRFFFELDLPLCKKKKERKDLQGFAGKVMVVDDNEVNLKLLQMLFEHLGQIELLLFSDPQEALKHLSEDIDLIFLDIEMEKMSGVELLKTLRQKGYKMPVVALTAHAGSKERARFLNLGFDEYLSKPIEKEKLLRICNKYLEAIPNVERIAQDMGLSAEEYGYLLELYCNSIDKELEKLHKLIKVKKFQEASKQAHKIAGSSSSVRMMEASAVAKEMERKLKAKESVDELFAKLRRLVDRCKRVYGKELLG